MSPALEAFIRPVVIRGLQLQEWCQSRVTYNPLSPSVYLDPYPTYARMRERDPVHWSPLLNAWVVTRFADTDAILRDHKRFSNDPRHQKHRRTRSSGLESPAQSLLFLDPPDHTRLRALVSRAFTPPAIAAMVPRIEAIVRELLDAIPDSRDFDLMDVLAGPLPIIVIAEMLGVPAEDRAQFKRWSNQRARALEPTIKPHEAREANLAGRELDAYFSEAITRRQRAGEPGADLLGTLIAAEEAGDKLSSEEILIMLRLLLIAGNETTTNLIGNGALTLLQHPDQANLLRRNPDLLDTAVDELLRYDTPVQLDQRTALCDLEIGGRPIREGQVVLLIIGAANRDPAMFPEPDRLDLTRRNGSHISFGRGIHHCLGAPLARVEARVAFAMLFDRFPGLALRSTRPDFRDNVVLRGLRSLRVGA